MSSNNAFTMNLSRVADILGTEFIGDDTLVKSISTDTRTLEGGELFVALKGENFDANEFAVKAMQQGAAACVTEKRIDGVDHCVVVKDTRVALAQLARAWRAQFDIPVIAITGSNGKTTVKEMIASVLSQQGNVLATQGNLNNDIGVPLTLFRLNEHHTSAIIEMGANHPGEIAYLVDIVNPEVGIVNNAAAAHLEGFGSLEGVARSKGEMFAGLNENATAIINADDQFVSLWSELAGTRNKVYFGLGDNADVTAQWEAGPHGSTLSVSTPEQSFTVQLPLPGKHNVMNALAAIAACTAAGITVQAIKAGLESMSSVKGRLQVKAGINGSQVIDDTYNANPGSLNVAIDVLKNFSGQHYLALGDMAELGEESQSLHEQAGIKAKESGIHRLFTLGPLAELAGKAFGRGAQSFQQHDDLIKELKNELHEQTTLLVKGSRSMHMEKIVDAVSVES